MVVVDSRAQLRCWRQMQQSEWWGEVTALVSEATPESYVDELTALGIDVIVAGEERVDLRRVESQHRYGTQVVGVDTGVRIWARFWGRPGVADERHASAPRRRGVSRHGSCRAPTRPRRTPRPRGKLTACGATRRGADGMRLD